MPFLFHWKPRKSLVLCVISIYFLYPLSMFVAQWQFQSRRWEKWPSRDPSWKHSFCWWWVVPAQSSLKYRPVPWRGLQGQKWRQGQNALRFKVQSWREQLQKRTLQKNHELRKHLKLWEGNDDIMAGSRMLGRPKKKPTGGMNRNLVALLHLMAGKSMRREWKANIHAPHRETILLSWLDLDHPPGMQKRVSDVPLVEATRARSSEETWGTNRPYDRSRPTPQTDGWGHVVS